LPDDSSHFVAVEFNDWILNLDLRHRSPFQKTVYRGTTDVTCI
jgi:hypothetical protein